MRNERESKRGHFLGECIQRLSSFDDTFHERSRYTVTFFDGFACGHSRTRVTIVPVGVGWWGGGTESRTGNDVGMLQTIAAAISYVALLFISYARMRRTSSRGTGSVSPCFVSKVLSIFYATSFSAVVFFRGCLRAPFREVPLVV